RPYLPRLPSREASHPALPNPHHCAGIRALQPWRLEHREGKLGAFRSHLVARISWAERLGPGSVEDHSPFGERDFAGRWSSCSHPSLYGRQIWLSSPRWEDATPHPQPLRCPPCHSRPTPIAVTTFRSSRIG